MISCLGRVTRVRLGLLLVSALVAGTGFILLGRDLYLGAKAILAEQLIDHAFAAHLSDGHPHPPWAWADHWPIAELEVPRLGQSRHVLNNADESSLAFGVGHMAGTAPPGTDGRCVLVGHRSSVFAFLKNLKPGEELVIRTRTGKQRYRLGETMLITDRDTWLVDPASREELVLYTCWPFNGLLAGDKRFAAVFRPVAD